MKRTKHTVTPSSPMLAGMDALIELLKRQVSDLASNGMEESGTMRDVPSVATVREQMEDLDLFLHRLNQIRDWLTQDERLLAPVDEAIGKQVRALEQRQTQRNYILAFITTVGGAILGWLISLIGTPMTILHLLWH